MPVELHPYQVREVESDTTYFARNPRASSRIRLAFPGEFPAGALGPVPTGHTVVVVVAVRRDLRTGAIERARGVYFLPAGSG